MYQIEQKNPKSKRKVTVVSQPSSQIAKPNQDQGLITPEGATLLDICPFVHQCLNESCPLYHPKWAQPYCISYVLGKCNNKNKCRLQHAEWEEVVGYADESDLLFDCFSHNGFKKPKFNTNMSNT